MSSKIAAIEADGPLLEIPDPAADPAMDAVAARVAGLVEDRATLQLGRGRLQSAVLRAVHDRRGLRILPHGKLWRIEGPGVESLTTDLAALTVTP